MAKLPKSIIKKYGISKKAWAVFRGSKKAKKSTRGTTMARRKYKGHKSKSGSKGGFMAKATQFLLGAAGAVAYDVFLSPMIPLSGMIKNIVEFIVGVWLAVSKRMPTYVRSFGAALAIMNAYEIITPFITGKPTAIGSVSPISAFMQG